MKKKSTRKKIPKAKLEKLVRACQMAYGDHPIDGFMDQIFKETERQQRLSAARGEQSRCE